MNKIKQRIGPDDDVAVLDMDDDLCKIKLHKRKNPNNPLEDIAEVKVQYKCVLLKEKKAAVMVRAGKFNYAAVITVIGTTVRANHARGATDKELVAKMHK